MPVEPTCTRWLPVVALHQTLALPELLVTHSAPVFLQRVQRTEIDDVHVFQRAAARADGLDLVTLRIVLGERIVTWESLKIVAT